MDAPSSSLSGLPFALHLEPRWLVLTSPAPQRMMSWAIHNGGLMQARRVAWHTVTDADLPPGLDAAALFRERLTARGWQDAVGLMTARAVAKFHVGEGTVAGIRAVSIFTVGLENAERIGTPKFANDTYCAGTINSFTWISTPLTDTGLVEALAMAVQARTLTLLEHAAGKGIKSGATGTGTDCVVVACPLPAPGETPRTFAGLHTPVAHAIGLSVAQAMPPGSMHGWSNDVSETRVCRSVETH